MRGWGGGIDPREKGCSKKTYVRVCAIYLVYRTDKNPRLASETRAVYYTPFTDIFFFGTAYSREDIKFKDNLTTVQTATRRSTANPEGFRT